MSSLKHIIISLPVSKRLTVYANCVRLYVCQIEYLKEKKIAFILAKEFDILSASWIFCFNCTPSRDWCSLAFAGFSIFQATEPVLQIKFVKLQIICNLGEGGYVKQNSLFRGVSVGVLDIAVE